MPRDFWTEFLVMKLTKLWMSASLLDSNLSTVGFLIIDLVTCLACSEKKTTNNEKRGGPNFEACDKGLTEAVT